MTIPPGIDSKFTWHTGERDTLADYLNQLDTHLAAGDLDNAAHTLDQLTSHARSAATRIRAAAGETPLDDISSHYVDRAVEATLIHGGHPAGSWTSRDQAAVLLILNNPTSLAKADLTPTAAAECAADGMTFPPDDLNAWTGRLRTEFQQRLADTPRPTR